MRSSVGTKPSSDGSNGACRVCGSGETAETIQAKEQMFGSGERFAYMRCADCGCVQIRDVPDDLGRHYPAGYYSFTPRKASVQQRVRDTLAYFGPAALFGGREWWELGSRKSIRDGQARKADRILDLGCGGGELIASMRDAGYMNVLGADPYLDADLTHPNGAKVVKSDGRDLEGPFDLVMMHHSLEHVPDQTGLARELARLVTPGGRLVIRIPTIESWAAETYGPDWAHFEAPRHLYLHSRKSIRLLLEGAGFSVTRIIDDSASFSILASEHLHKGGLLSDMSRDRTAAAAAWRRARALNQQGRGDTIAVHARRLPHEPASSSEARATPEHAPGRSGALSASMSGSGGG